MVNLLFLFLSFLISLILTPLFRLFSLKFKIVDRPEKLRKIHQKPIPLLGGLAIFLSFFLVLFLSRQTIWFSNLISQADKITDKNLIGLFIGGIFLMIGGFLDDKYNLKPSRQLIWPILACLSVIISGIGIKFINNPLILGQNSYLFLDQWKINIFQFNQIHYYFTPWADLITFFWLLILMYSTKLLDGLDGLVSGLTTIGALSIAGLCFFTQFYQPEVGLMALILAGASLGFLFFNWHPAKIFLGEGGSLFAGFILGSLAIISGSKVATTFLILGLAIIDLISVIIQRVFIEKRSPFQGDQKHFHFRLLKAGFSHQTVVLFYWFFAAIFGLSALFLHTQGKVISLIVLIILGISLIVYFSSFKKIIKKE